MFFLFPVESSVVQYTIPFPNFVGKSIQIHEKMHKLLSPAALESFKAFSGLLKVIYPKYSKHSLSTVAHTIDGVCSKMLNSGLNYGLFLSIFKLIPCHIHWIVYVLAYLNFLFEFQRFFIMYGPKWPALPRHINGITIILCYVMLCCLIFWEKYQAI